MSHGVMRFGRQCCISAKMIKTAKILGKAAFQAVSIGYFRDPGDPHFFAKIDESQSNQ
jgi:hypothetical protein